RIAIQTAAVSLTHTNTAAISAKLFHNTAIAYRLRLIQTARGKATARNVKATKTPALTTHSRPLIPMNRLCTSCFHVDANNAASASSTIAIARGMPITSTNRCARSITTGATPDNLSASGVAMRTSIHAASALQIIAFILAAMIDPFVSGRVATKGVTPYVSLDVAPDLAAVAATKAAMKGGVKSTMRSASKMSSGVWLKGKSRANSNGSRMATNHGSERPCWRHSNHI